MVALTSCLSLTGINKQDLNTSHLDLIVYSHKAASEHTEVKAAILIKRVLIEYASWYRKVLKVKNQWHTFFVILTSLVSLKMSFTRIHI